MAPTTRRTFRDTTPDCPTKSYEHDTIRKTRFFRLYDEKRHCDSLRKIASQAHIHHTTGLRWLEERKILGSKAFRRSRKRSLNLGAPSKLSKHQCEMLVSPSRNPVRDQQYEAQIEYHGLGVCQRTLQRSLLKNTRNGRRYKQAYVTKILLEKNKDERVKYGNRNLGKTVEGFWKYIVFTDEAHVDPTSVIQGHILREEGTRYNNENIQERGKKEGVKLHIAGWVTWDEKCTELQFYHNGEEEKIEKPKYPRKPRKTMYQSKEEYEHCVQEWEAGKPHDVVVKPLGNSMTQKYYVERLLPTYIDAVNKLQSRYPSQQVLLQEDNDPSHGTGKKKGLAQELKEQHSIRNLVHPAQSPDLNPIEACWNILKQRVRRRVWNTLDELKDILQEEWSKITMEEVRTRISDMIGRCETLTRNGGETIKTALW
jgi:DDE superfamily endonuclease